MLSRVCVENQGGMRVCVHACMCEGMCYMHACMYEGMC
jgi:hypothetical protein